MLSQYLREHGAKNIEGNIEGSKAACDTLKQIVSDHTGTHFMEIGFNAGHSAEIMLRAKDDSVITSFDIGQHDYVKLAAKYMEEEFPHRHSLVLGDSTVTVPKYVQANPGKKFDLILIDGGHFYDTAKRDFFNCMRLAHEDTIVIMDDTVYEKDLELWYTAGPTKVWLEAVNNNFIIELGRVTFSIGRGMSWGKYNKNVLPK